MQQGNGKQLVQHQTASATLQQFVYSIIATKEATIKGNMMYQFVHGVSNIPEDILLLHPPSNYDTRNCSYFRFPMLERMLIITRK